MSDEESLALDDEVRAATDLHTTAVTMNQHNHIMSTLPPVIAISGPPPLRPLSGVCGLRPKPTPVPTSTPTLIPPSVGPGELATVTQSVAPMPRTVSPSITKVPLPSKVMDLVEVIPVRSPSSLPNVAPPLAPSPATSHSRPARTRRSVDRLSAQSLGNLRSMYALPSEVGAVAQMSTLYLHAGIPTPALYKASHNDPDTLNYDRAMNDVDSLDAWLAAANKEIHALEEKDCWDEILLSDVPANTQVLPTTWVFRIKRALDGTIKKYKARLCACGDLQICTEDAYAPVVAFLTVCFFLVASLILEWYTCSIDFFNAFVQSSLTSPIYIHVQRGFRTNNDMS